MCFSSRLIFQFLFLFFFILSPYFRNKFRNTSLNYCQLLTQYCADWCVKLVYFGQWFWWKTNFSNFSNENSNFMAEKKSLLFWINLINWNQIICFKVMKSSQIMSTNRSSPLCLSFKTLKSYYIPRKWMWWQRQRSELLMVQY